MHRLRLFSTVTVLAFLLFCVTRTYLSAQVAGATVTGTVSDEAGATIPNAHVNIKNTATGVVNEVTSNSDGFYTAPDILPGSYIITAAASGFTSHGDSVTLAVGQNIVLNFSLKVGAVSQTVVI